MARRKPKTPAALIAVRDAGEGWKWATYQFLGCEHTRDELYTPKSTPPASRKLYHEHDDEGREV